MCYFSFACAGGEECETDILGLFVIRRDGVCVVSCSLKWRRIEFSFKETKLIIK